MLPIVPHFQPDPSPEDIERVDRLADGLLREYPTLQLERDFRRLVPEHIGPGGTLHVDDLTAISFLDAGLDVRFYQERARLRRATATSSPPLSRSRTAMRITATTTWVLVRCSGCIRRRRTRSAGLQKAAGRIWRYAGVSWNG